MVSPPATTPVARPSVTRIRSTGQPVRMFTRSSSSSARNASTNRPDPPAATGRPKAGDGSGQDGEHEGGGGVVGRKSGVQQPGHPQQIRLIPAELSSTVRTAARHGVTQPGFGTGEALTAEQPYGVAHHPRRTQFTA